MRSTLLIPVLNEIEGMKAILPRINKKWVDEIIIVDGGSTDGSYAYAKERGYFVFVQKNPGFRNAYNEALPFIKGDIVITFSPDGNCIPELIPPLINKMKEGYDMIIVSRYLGDVKSEDDDIITAFGNWFFTKSINFLYGGRYTDAIGIFRAFKTKIIYDLELEKDDGYRTVERLFFTRVAWEPLLSVRALKRRLRITEIAGDEPARIAGQRKLQIFRWGAAYYFQFIRELFCWR